MFSRPRSGHSVTMVMTTVTKAAGTVSWGLVLVQVVATHGLSSFWDSKTQILLLHAYLTGGKMRLRDCGVFSVRVGRGCRVQSQPQSLVSPTQKPFHPSSPHGSYGNPTVAVLRPQVKRPQSTQLVQADQPEPSTGLGIVPVCFQSWRYQAMAGLVP